MSPRSAPQEPPARTDAQGFQTGKKLWGEQGRQHQVFCSTGRGEENLRREEKESISDDSELDNFIVRDSRKRGPARVAPFPTSINRIISPSSCLRADCRCVY